MFTLLISLVAFSSFTSLKHKSWIAGLFSFIFIMLEWFSFFYVFIWANIFCNLDEQIIKCCCYFCLVVNYFVIVFQNNVFIVDISYIWQRCPHGWPKATKFWAFSTIFQRNNFQLKPFLFLQHYFFVFFVFISCFYQIYLWGTYWDNMKQPAAILVLQYWYTILVVPVFSQNLPVSAILVQITDTGKY